MRRPAVASAQRGAAITVALIMLVLITILVTSAFRMSTTNLQSVGNMQFRQEAVAAANKAVEQVLSTPFSDAPTADVIEVDIDNSGTADYAVDVAAPTCVSAIELANPSAPPSSISLGAAFASATSSYFQTVWDLDATVTDPNSGTSVRVRQGVRVLLTEAQKALVCP